MCGICGIFKPLQSDGIDEGTLTVMARSLEHRGPDDEGIYITPDRRAGLGFRRLSIVDLSEAGHQPMSDEDGKLWIVFNGEIYNHLELRKELESKGHRYKSRTDTETILHGYEQWGPDVVHKLRGMFAFAIWEAGSGSLFMARDRIGIKPLYYAANGSRLAFASEIKAILTLPWIAREVDRTALGLYLGVAAVPAPATLFKGISKLPAGHRMKVDGRGRITVERYWDPLPSSRQTRHSEEFYVERLRELLSESIKLRMMSDVPFGVFLSGGIDSSLNVALMARLMNRPVDTFSVAIKDDTESDELVHARNIARHFGAEHHEIRIGASEFLDFLPRMAWHQDEPLADPVCVPLYHVSRLARQNGTIVVQVGEGSDELFCGYETYRRHVQIHPLWKCLTSLPGPARKPAAEGLSRLWPALGWYLDPVLDNSPPFSGGARGFSERQKQKLLGQGFDTALAPSWVDSLYRHRRSQGLNTGLLDDIIYIELMHRLPELLLMRVDKMTMATSVEARVPFLDHELVKFALSIPAGLKWRKGTSKYVLKRAARGIIPDDVITRPKKGFCGSSGNMVRNYVVNAAEALVSSNPDLRALLNWDYLGELIKQNRAGDLRSSFPIWILFNLALWFSVWIQGVDQGRLREWLRAPDPESQPARYSS